MKKIKVIIFSYLRNDAHYEFLVEFRSLLVKYPAVQAIVAALYEAFTALLLKEEELINAMRKSDYTVQIADADHRVDRTITGMRELVVSAMHHFDPAVVAAAQSLYNRFQAFGDIAKKSYEEETAVVNLLIVDLNNPDYLPKVNLVGMLPWVHELVNAETAFEELLAQRNVADSQKPDGRLKDVRREIEDVYRQMTERIAAAAIMDATPATDAFIAELNTKIAYFNEHNHHHARKDISITDHCVVEPIATQAHTGKPVSVIPKVHYREEGKPTVELVFAKDFDVTYKNNTDVGTADLTIHGKGAYKGQKLTTFNIAR
ncbi:MAG: DUF6261 family protein [Prevotellaceae bacterium]|jgi:hypothetical protein|nr:DUF6261 family protein [Prevotellaceae bacterium]